ncbi:MAG: GGDEF domain-containing protein, partial [Candidatus Hydrogenedentes bacterium]|nr:GGDEF domain-containing protein [Candidatus Hydrogenedentota bacterium]
QHVCIAAYDASEVASKESALREANDQLTALSRTDPLTGLCNRREIERLLHHAEIESRRYGQTFSVLLIDVDHFKRVNDTHGHAAGDEALRLVGRLLVRQLRGPDTAARFGGEEFLVCLPLARANEAMVTAERLRVAVETALVESPPHSFQVTASIGVAEWNERLEGYLALIDQADQALYRAKRDGRNRCVSANVSE